MDENAPPANEVKELELRIGQKIDSAVSGRHTQGKNVVPASGETDLQSLLGTGESYYEKITGDLGERGIHELSVNFPDHEGHIVDTGGLVCAKPEDEILFPLVEHCYVLVADETLPSGEKVRIASHDVTFSDAIILRTTLSKLKEIGTVDSCTVAFNGAKGLNKETFPKMVQKVQDATGISITPVDFTDGQEAKNIPFDLIVKGDSFTAFDLTGYSKDEE